LIDSSPQVRETNQRDLEWSYLGRLDYRSAMVLQEHRRERIRSGGADDALLLLEHGHVYTLGRNANRTDVLADREWLRTRGVEVVECDRGGQVTYHGPGQLVGYPILDLTPDRRDLRRYVRDLQEVLVRVLAEVGLSAEARSQSPEIGVWVDGRKVASLGVHVSRWITTHGFALNVNTDLSYFAAIVPCGLQGVEMTSVAELTGRTMPIEDLADLCARHLAEVFHRRPLAVSPEQLKH
jgi:lipoyl(octanoyl) transferase